MREKTDRETDKSEADTFGPPMSFLAGEDWVSFGSSLL